MGVELQIPVVEDKVGVPFVDLGPTHAVVQEQIVEGLRSIVQTGAFVDGIHVATFEERFAQWCGRSECVGVASGLDALRLGLLALGLEPGDEVLVPAMTFVATFEAVVQAGGVPIPVDVREDDCCIDVDAAEHACGARTRFVVPVHLYGQMADMARLRGVADERDLVILEDACQAHGATRDGQTAGAAGDGAAFSFYPSKNLGAMGDAGAFVTNDPDVAAHVRALRSHGQTRRYHSEHVGYTARLDALQAMVLSCKLPHLDRWNDARITAAAWYAEALDGVGDLVLPSVVDGARHVWHLYAVRTAEPEALARFLGERGIATGRHYPEPPPYASPYRSSARLERRYPVAEAIGSTTLSLPLFPGISEAQVETVVRGVHAYFSQGV